MNYPEFENLVSVVSALRDPEHGCPWDLKQNHQTLLPYLLEESYEFIEAAENNDTGHMCEELGDVLLQILLHSKIAEQNKHFTLEDVSKKLAQKLVHRHPHVFGPKGKKLSPQEVSEQWQEIKSKDKTQTSTIPSKLANHPALKASYLIGVASGKVNFDWENHLQVMHKVEEEWQELKSELSPLGGFDSARVKEEMGDLLFSMAQLARHLGVEPEEALRAGNKKFLSRFHKVEKMAKDDGKKMGEISSAEMEALWVRAKKMDA